MVDAETVRGGLLGGLAPLGVGFVVEDDVGAEGAEGVGFTTGGGGGDDAGAGRFGELLGGLDQLPFRSELRGGGWFWGGVVFTCKAKMLTPPVPCVKTVWPGFKAFDSSP